MSNKVILDASALLALIQEEKGAEIVRPLLKFSVMSTINVAETLTTLQRTDIAPAESLVLVSDIISEVIPFDLDLARVTAELQPLVKISGLSLADRACIALGIQMKSPVYTADKAWAKLKLDCEIILIR